METVRRNPAVAAPPIGGGGEGWGCDCAGCFHGRCRRSKGVSAAGSRPYRQNEGGGRHAWSASVAPGLCGDGSRGASTGRAAPCRRGGGRRRFLPSRWCVRGVAAPSGGLGGTASMAAAACTGRVGDCRSTRRGRTGGIVWGGGRGGGVAQCGNPRLAWPTTRGETGGWRPWAGSHGLQRRWLWREEKRGELCFASPVVLARDACQWGGRRDTRVAPPSVAGVYIRVQVTESKGGCS